MITVISGTNRPGALTAHVARAADGMLRDGGVDTRMLNLSELPPSMFDPDAYTSKPPELSPFVDAILNAAGVLTVVPEYNGGFPGVLKYFIDMLPFPESLMDCPAAFIGLSSGPWGAVRAVEQLKMVFQYRHAHLYGRSCFLPIIGRLVDVEGRLVDPDAERRLAATVHGFAAFCQQLSGGGESSADR
jgi:NAD(P)H-dependent FMN reductase